MYNGIFLIIYCLKILILYDEFSYAKNYKLQDKINPTYKKYFSNGLIKTNSNLVANNNDLENFCKDYANAKNLQLNLFPPELIYDVYDECLIKGVKWMRKYERNKSSNKKSIEQIMIEKEEIKREARERSLQQKKILKERYENNFDDLFR